MHLLLILLLATATEGAPTPAEAYRMLQAAVEKRDVAALTALVHPSERAWMRRDLERDGAEAVFKRIPTGPWTVHYESPNAVNGYVPSGDAVTFTRKGSRWYVGGLFDEKPAPNGPPITAAKAYEVLRAKAREVNATARLAALNTTTRFGLAADGSAFGWVGYFISDDGQPLTVSYERGEIEGPSRVPGPNRKGFSDPDTLSFDSKALYEETVRRTASIVDPIKKITASLHRSARTGEAIWMLDVYGADDRIGVVVVYDGRTLKFSHQTK